MKINTATYGGLLDDNAFDGKVFDVNVFGISVGLCVLEETKNELDGFLRPATYAVSFVEIGPSSFEHPIDAPCVALNSFAWLARPTPPEKRRKGMTRLWSLTSLR